MTSQPASQPPQPARPSQPGGISNCFQATARRATSTEHPLIYKLPQRETPNSKHTSIYISSGCAEITIFDKKSDFFIMFISFALNRLYLEGRVERKHTGMQQAARALQRSLVAARMKAEAACPKPVHTINAQPWHYTASKHKFN